MASVFTQIINRQIPANILYEDDKVIAFYDINPVREGHFLVVPKDEKTNLITQDEQDFLYAMKIARKLAKEQVIDKNIPGFKIVINTGSSAGQVVFHTHIHVIPYNE